MVGGIVRDRLLGKVQQVDDIDITCGNSDSLVLPHILANSDDSARIKMMHDNHSQVIIDGVKYDFSSNYRSPSLNNILQKVGLTKASDIQKEGYSRDFTCNSLLLDFSFKNLADPTGMGKADIQNHLIRTCLPARITLSDNIKRIPRVFYMAAKLGFRVDDEIINWIKTNPEVLARISQEEWSKKIVKAIHYNEFVTIELLTKCNAWHALPYIPALAQVQIRHQ